MKKTDKQIKPHHARGELEGELFLLKMGEDGIFKFEHLYEFEIEILEEEYEYLEPPYTVEVDMNIPINWALIV